MNFIPKRYAASIFLCYCILLVSCFNIQITLFFSISILLFFLLQFQKNKLNKFKPYLVFISICNYLVFQIMVASYAELLEWENILIVVFYSLTYYYYFFECKKPEKEISIYKTMK